MDKTSQQTPDVLNLVAWAHANRQRLILTAAIVAAIGCIVGFMMWSKNHREATANEALANLVPPTGIQSATAADAEPYIKVANEFTGTAAGARARLQAGQILFDAGKFSDARAQFEQFMGQYPNYPLVSQGAVGVAACMEAEGKTAEATARYEDIATRHAVDSTTAQVKSALARLYMAQNKPEQALQQYEEMLRSGNNDSWTSEANLQRGELLAKYPKLVKPVAPPPSTGLPSPSAPTLLQPVK